MTASVGVSVDVGARAVLGCRLIDGSSGEQDGIEMAQAQCIHEVS